MSVKRKVTVPLRSPSAWGTVRFYHAPVRTPRPAPACRLSGRKTDGVTVGAGELGRLTDRFAGEIVRPGDPGYDAARAVWNSMIDRRPALMLRPHSTAAFGRP